jgi:glycosyltransferase involved in cell wall biosynthesis
MNHLPNISIIIPCYNQALFLNETCISVINQTYINWEALIINDGSTDNTEIVALEICKKDSRFKYFHKSNGGLSSARNLGIENATGEFIQFLDSDDLIEPSKFEESLATNSDLTITNFEMLKDGKRRKPFCTIDGEKINFETILLNWDVKYSIPIHCGLFKASIVKKIKFNEELKAKEDWCFWLDFLNFTEEISFINYPLAIYRLHNSNMCKDQKHMLENTKKVYSIIYHKIDEKYRNLYFDRINNELSHEKYKYEYILNKYKIKKKQTKILIATFVFLSLIYLTQHIIRL